MPGSQGYGRRRAIQRERHLREMLRVSFLLVTGVFVAVFRRADARRVYTRRADARRTDARRTEYIEHIRRFCQNGMVVRQKNVNFTADSHVEAGAVVLFGGFAGERMADLYEKSIK